jgi:hypothetical protein
MPGTSYLTGLDASIINQVRRDMLYTRIALNGSVALVLHRRNVNTGEPVQRPAQTVYLKLYDPRGASVMQQRLSGSLDSGVLTGTLTRETPFDVQEGDAFTYQGWSAEVIVVHPANAAGIIRAEFEIRTGFSP